MRKTTWRKGAGLRTLQNCILLLSILASGRAFSQCDVFNLARNGTAEQMGACLSANAALADSINPSGHSPLILAAYSANTEAVNELLRHKPDVNYISPDGTALMAAVVKGQVDIAKVLLANGADPNIGDAQKNTPLIYAAMFQNTELVKLLLASGSRKDATDARGNDALTYAKMHQNSELILLLHQ